MPSVSKRFILFIVAGNICLIKFDLFLLVVIFNLI